MSQILAVPTDSEPTAGKKIKRSDSDNVNRYRSASVPFGRTRKDLPLVLESLVFSFLYLGDLAPLFLSSRGLSVRVIEWLGSTKVLLLFHIAHQYSWCIALAAKHCRALTRIELRLFPFGAASAVKWLQALLENNRSSLRIVNLPSSLWDARSVQDLLRCRHLEEFVQMAQMPIEAVRMLTVANLPCLRSLVLRTGNWGDGSCTQSELCTVLSQGWQVWCARGWTVINRLFTEFSLTSLSLNTPGRDALSKLTAPHFRGVCNLELALYPNGSPYVVADVARDVGCVLANMPKLHQLSISLDDQLYPENSHQLARIEWTLPSLCRLTFSGCDFPVLRAPMLERLQCLHLTPELLNRVVDWVANCRSISTLDLRAVSSRFFDCASGFVAALQAKQLPNLTALKLSTTDIRLPKLLTALSRCCFRLTLFDWELSKLDMVCSADILALLSGQRFLQTLKLRAEEPTEAVLAAGEDAFQTEQRTQPKAASCVVSILSSLYLAHVHIDETLFTSCVFPALRELVLCGKTVHLESVDCIFDTCSALTQIGMETDRFPDSVIRNRCQTPLWQ